MKTPEQVTANSTGYESSRFNAVRHGILSQYTILPWEDPDEYQQLLEALVAEHSPEGPTEEHLVEELVGILWRKRRLRMAEGAAFHRGLRDAMQTYNDVTEAALVPLDPPEQFMDEPADAIRATPQETQKILQSLDKCEAKAKKSLDLLCADKADAYDKALTVLDATTRIIWEKQFEWKQEHYGDDLEHYTADAAGLRRFIEAETQPTHDTRRKELESRARIRTQAHGEAFDPDKLDRLARYETHLDRKLQHTLSMLLRLRDLREANGQS